MVAAGASASAVFLWAMACATAIDYVLHGSIHQVLRMLRQSGAETRAPSSTPATWRTRRPVAGGYAADRTGSTACSTWRRADSAGAGRGDARWDGHRCQASDAIRLTETRPGEAQSC